MQISHARPGASSSRPGVVAEDHPSVVFVVQVYQKRTLIWGAFYSGVGFEEGRGGSVGPGDEDVRTGLEGLNFFKEFAARDLVDDEVEYGPTKS
jgi:hypothetical protein